MIAIQVLNQPKVINRQNQIKVIKAKRKRN